LFVIFSAPLFGPISGPTNCLDTLIAAKPKPKPQAKAKSKCLSDKKMGTAAAASEHASTSATITPGTTLSPQAEAAAIAILEHSALPSMVAGSNRDRDQEASGSVCQGNTIISVTRPPTKIKQEREMREREK